jgi:hypothetical protein
VNASIRRDGVSKFSPENRFEYFPSISGAWILTKEDFLEDSNLINSLKVRAGWGQLGRQEVPSTSDYLRRYQTGLSNQQYNFGNTIIPFQPLYTNPDIGWEILTEINLGVDFELFNNRLSGSVDVFERTADDLLSNVPVPDGVIFSNQGFQNIGEFVSKGIEVNLDYNVIRRDDLSWNMNYNFTAIDREITNLAYGQDIFAGGITGGTRNAIQVQREGAWPTSFFTYAQLYDQARQPIEKAYADFNGDGTVDDRDRYVSGNGQADVLMGFQSNFTHKNFDFNFNLRASFENDIYNNVNS